MPSLQAPARQHGRTASITAFRYMWGPNFLMYNTDVVTPAPTSWDSCSSRRSTSPNPYAGKITAYDGPIYIADAALYLMAHQPDLGIKDPYELTQEQLDAAVDLLKQQSGMISKYWALYTDEIDGFDAGRHGGRHRVAGEPARTSQPTARSGRLRDPVRGGHRLGRHVDDVAQRAAPELHAEVDAVHDAARRADHRCGVLRRDAGNADVVRRS